MQGAFQEHTGTKPFSYTACRNPVCDIQTGFLRTRHGSGASLAKEALLSAHTRRSHLVDALRAATTSTTFQLSRRVTGYHPGPHGLQAATHMPSARRFLAALPCWARGATLESWC